MSKSSVNKAELQVMPRPPLLRVKHQPVHDAIARIEDEASTLRRLADCHPDFAPLLNLAASQLDSVLHGVGGALRRRLGGQP